MKQVFCPNRDCPDAQLTRRPGEYRSDVRTCPRCHTALVSSKPEWATTPATPSRPSPWDSELDWEEFESVAHIQRSEHIPLIKSLLQAANIRYVIKNERSHELHGYVRLSPGGYNSIWWPEVLVEPCRAEEARALLNRLNADA